MADEPSQAQARQGSDRREALVRAAFDGIAENGLEGLRLRDVAARAGIDHSTVHHYFATKQDLIAEVVAYATRQFWPTMPTEGPPAARLRQHLTALSVMIRQQPGLFAVLHEFDARAGRDGAIRLIVERHEAGWRTVLTDLFRSGTRIGVWDDRLDATTAAELVIAAIKGVSLLPQQAEAVLQQLGRLLVTEPPGLPTAPP